MLETEALYRGFEEGVLDWDAIPTLQEIFTEHDVYLTGSQPAHGGVWIWLNDRRFFFAYPGGPPPPKKAKVISVKPRGLSVEILFRKGRRVYQWIGDTLRCKPARTF